MTKSELDTIVEQMAKAVVDVLKANVDPLKRELVELRSMRSIDAHEIAELKSTQAKDGAKAFINFRGVYAPGATYDRGDAVTRSGGLWIALERTAGLPGGNAPDSRAWQLAVKSGPVKSLD